MKVTRLAGALLVAVAALHLTAPSVRAAEQMRVILDWFVNPDHAPLIVAARRASSATRARGRDRRPGRPERPAQARWRPSRPTSRCPTSRSSTSRWRRACPVVRIGTLVGHAAELARGAGGRAGEGLADLKGRKVGYSVGGFEDALLGAMLAKAGPEARRRQLVNVNFSLSPALARGRSTPVIGAFRNFELNQLDILGRPAAPSSPRRRACRLRRAGLHRPPRRPGRPAARRVPGRGRARLALARQPPGGGLGGVQGHRPRHPRRRAEPPRLGRHAAALRPQPGGPRPRPLRPVRGVPGGAGADPGGQAGRGPTRSTCSRRRSEPVPASLSVRIGQDLERVAVCAEPAPRRPRRVRLA
jgi:hypothetical protein